MVYRFTGVAARWAATFPYRQGSRRYCPVCESDSGRLLRGAGRDHRPRPLHLSRGRRSNRPATRVQVVSITSAVLRVDEPLSTSSSFSMSAK
jgi:hypothetical protein